MSAGISRFVEQVWMMGQSDVCGAGEALGYDWNEVCSAVSKAGFYAEDGDGTMTVSRGDDHGNDIINAIMDAVFAAVPQADSITISN